MTSFLELYEEVEPIEAGWAHFKLLDHINVKGCPTVGDNTYPKQWWRWIQQNFKGSCESYNSVLHCKVFYKQTQDLELMDAYVTRSWKHCNFLSRSFSTPGVMAANHDVLSCITKYFRNTIPEFYFRLCVLTTLKLPLPTLGENGEGRPAILQGNCDEQIKLLRCPMGGSVAVNRKEKTPKRGLGRGSAAEAAEEEGQSQKAKRARNRNAKTDNRPPA